MADRRYQDCSIPVKAWRRRHYLKIPFRAYRLWVRSRYPFDPTLEPFTWDEAKSLATGLAQGDMNWYYDSDEVLSRLKRKYQ